MESGCIFNPWAFNNKYKEAAYNVAEQLGCQRDDPKEIVQYLLTIPATDLVKCTISNVKFEVCTLFFLNFKYSLLYF